MNQRLGLDDDGGRLMGRGSCVLISPCLMAWIVYSNERSTGEARRAIVFLGILPPNSHYSFYCASLHPIHRLQLLSQSRDPAYLFFSRQNPPSLGASRTKRSIGIPTARFRPTCGFATLLALRRLLPHLPPLYTTQAASEGGGECGV